MSNNGRFVKRVYHPHTCDKPDSDETYKQYAVGTLWQCYCGKVYELIKWYAGIEHMLIISWREVKDDNTT